MYSGGLSPPPFGLQHPSSASIDGTSASPISLSSPAQRQTSLSPSTKKMFATRFQSSRLEPAETTTHTSPRAEHRSFAQYEAASQRSPALAAVAINFEEELRSVELILSTLSSSLAFYQRGSVDGLRVGAEIATPQDAKDFVSYFTAILTSSVAHADLSSGGHSKHLASQLSPNAPRLSSEAILLQLLFDNSYDVISIFTEIVALAPRSAVAPARSTASQQQDVRSAAAGGSNASTAGLSIKSSAVAAALIAAHDAQEDFACLRVAVVDALKHIITLSFETAQQPPTSAAPPTSLISLLKASLSRCSTLRRLLDIVVHPTSPEELRVAAVETLFVYFLQSPPVSTATSTANQLSSSSSSSQQDAQLLLSFYEQLVKVVLLDTSRTVGSFAAGILRSFATAFPLSHVVTRSIPSLLRVLSQNLALDTRTLCCEIVDTVVRRAAESLEHSVVDIHMITEAACTALEQASMTFHSVAQLSVVSSQHGRRESSLQHAAEHDFLAAVCQLLHSAASLATSTVTADAIAVFRLISTRGCVHRLATLCRVARDALHVSNAAAALLALLVTRGPPSLNLPMAVADQKSSPHLVHAVIVSIECEQAASAADSTQRGSLALLQFHLAVITCSSLLYSPIARAEWRRALIGLSQWEQSFVKCLHSALSAADLDLFLHVVLLDEHGVVLNEPNGVEWDDDAHPSAHSIQCLVDAQEMRRGNKTGGLAASQSLWRSVENMRRVPDSRRGYLCFILMGYALLTLSAPPPSLTASPVTPTAEKEDVRFEPRRAPPETYGLYDKFVASAASQPAVPVNRQQPTSTPVAYNAADATHAAQQAMRREFESALKLAIQLSAHYHRNVLTHDAASTLYPATTTPRPASSSSTTKASSARGSTNLSSASQSLRNPFAKPRVSNEKAIQMRAWTARAVEEGDLFFFSIPLAALNVTVVEAVIAKARRHQSLAKKMFLTTPQSQRERRWFLLDLHSHIMPSLISMFLAVKKLLSVQSEEHVKMALQVLPSLSGLHRHRAVGGAAAGSAADSKSITCANILDVCDFVTQTFSIRMSDGSFADPAGSFSFAHDNKAHSHGTSAVDPKMAAAFFAPLFANQLRSDADDNAATTSNQTAPAKRKLMFDVSPSSSDSDETEDSSDSELLDEPPFEARMDAMRLVRSDTEDADDDDDDLELKALSA